MIDEDEIVPSQYRPVAVISLSALYSYITPDGGYSISKDVADLIKKFTEKGYYILIDSHQPLLEVADKLRHDGVNFNGITYDEHFGHAYSEIRFKDRVEAHAGFECLQAVVDEDISILSMCAGYGISTFQIMAGSLIYQSCNGRRAYAGLCHKDVYRAGPHE